MKIRYTNPYPKNIPWVDKPVYKRHPLYQYRAAEREYDAALSEYVDAVEVLRRHDLGMQVPPLSRLAGT